jgi:pimeloyl-ACP methyl ester carboxylesterase
MQLVFIHGSGASGKVWKYQTEHFPGSIAVTLPGHPEGECLDSIPAMVGWLKQYYDEHGLSNLVLAGHSIGGGVALQYALDYPEDLLALISIGSGGRLRVHPDTIASTEQALANSSSIAPMVEGFWRNASGDIGADLIIDGLALGPAVFLSDFKACDSFDVMDRLGEIDLPTLAIVGTKDVMTPEKYARFLVEKMQHARIVTIEGGTHAVFVEYPEQVNVAIEQFLEGLA